MLAIQPRNRFNHAPFFTVTGYKNPVASPLVLEGLQLNPANFRITANGVPLLLRPIEFRLLQFLMENPEQVHSRSAILQQVWDSKIVVGKRTIDVHIRHLRIVLQPFAMDAWIKTHPTWGYSFSAAN